MRRAAPSACPGCQSTLARFKETGRLGCSRCYDHFEEMIRGLLPGIHAGASAHRGKVPR